MPQLWGSKMQAENPIKDWKGGMAEGGKVCRPLACGLRHSVKSSTKDAVKSPTEVNVCYHFIAQQLTDVHPQHSS